MGKIVKTTDFVGKYSVSQNNHTESTLQSFIDKYELQYLYDLLGISLGDEFYADIAPNTFLPPTTPIYATLFNRLYADSTSGYCGQIRSDGVKEMMLGFIYWEYVRATGIKHTITGNVVLKNEVSTQANWNETEVYNNYNEAVKTYRSIQIYINQNKTDYPDYKGIMKTFNHWFV